MRGFHRIAFIGIEKEPVWPENKNDRHYSLTFSIDIHYRGRCPQAVVSAPFPPSCRCQQNGGVKQKFVVVAAMVGQQLPCALRRAMCPASGDDAVRRHFLAPCPFCAGPAFLSNPPTILNFSRGFLLIHRAAWAVCRSGLRNPAPGGCRWVKGFMATLGRSPCSPPFPRWQSQNIQT